MKSNDLQYPVLVVDDEADIRDLMEMTLMKMGLRVETAVGVDDYLVATAFVGQIGCQSKRARRKAPGCSGRTYASRSGCPTCSFICAAEAAAHSRRPLKAV